MSLSPEGDTVLGPVCIFKIKHFSLSLIKLDKKNHQTSEIHHPTLRTCGKVMQGHDLPLNLLVPGRPLPSNVQNVRELPKERIRLSSPPPALNWPLHFAPLAGISLMKPGDAGLLRMNT